MGAFQMVSCVGKTALFSLILVAAAGCTESSYAARQNKQQVESPKPSLADAQADALELEGAKTVIDDRYRLFVPAQRKVDRTKKPLLVAIHGCLQNAEIMQKGADLDVHAEREGYYVLYPEQLKNRHRKDCWRWWDRANREPNSGELAEILEMIDQTSERYAIDTNKIFVAGLSSGGATAAALMACHPERFKGAALVAAPAFDVASSELAAGAVLKYGPTLMRGVLPSSCKPALNKQRLLVIYGTDDRVVNPLHSAKLMRQFVPSDVKSVSRQLKLSSHGARATNTKCREIEATKSEACLIEVNGLKHAWAGGIEQEYFDVSAFSGSELILKYLLRGESPFEHL